MNLEIAAHIGDDDLSQAPGSFGFTQVPRSGEALVGCFASTGLLPRPVSRTTRAIADARRPRRSLRTDLFISSSLVGDSLRGVRQARFMVFTSYQYCLLEYKQGPASKARRPCA